MTTTLAWCPREGVSTRLRRPCIGRRPDGSPCGILAYGSRCPHHQAQRDAHKTVTYHRAGWRAYARALLAAEPWCHACGRRDVELVAGHYVSALAGGRSARPICRSCNAREG